MSIKEQVYVDERPADLYMRFHERTRSRPPDLMYELVRIITCSIYAPLNRVRAIDPQNVPASGPVILVPNHSSFIDHFYTGFHLRRRLQFMAKSQIFKLPMSFVYNHGGVFPVQRGRSDEEAFKTAHAILQRDGSVLMYAEGGRTRTGRPGEAKRGVGRLALESGVTVVPVALYGSQFTREFRRLRFPQVTVRYGTPLRFDPVENPSPQMQSEASRIVFDRVVTMWNELEAARAK